MTLADARPSTSRGRRFARRVAAAALAGSTVATLAVAAPAHADDPDLVATWNGGNSLWGTAADSNFVYVSDPGSALIKKFTVDGTFVENFDTPTGSGSSYPTGIDIAPDGSVLVADSGRSQVLRYGADGTQTATYGDYASLGGMYDVAVDASGNLYVGRTNGTIVKLNSSGTVLATYGSASQAGSWAGWRVAVADNGTIYAADYNQNVRIFSADGTFQQAWDGVDVDESIGAFSGTDDIAFDASGNIYVSEEGGTVRAYTAGLDYLTTYTGVSGPWGLDVANGFAYVGQASGQVAKFRIGRTGTDPGTDPGTPGTPTITQWGTSGTGDGQLNAPRDTAVDNSGHVYVADEYNGRIQKFDVDGTWIATWVPPTPVGGYAARVA